MKYANKLYYYEKECVDYKTEQIFGIIVSKYTDDINRWIFIFKPIASRCIYIFPDGDEIGEIDTHIQHYNNFEYISDIKMIEADKKTRKKVLDELHNNCVYELKQYSETKNNIFYLEERK